jgi:hypothetical protein
LQYFFRKLNDILQKSDEKNYLRGHMGENAPSPQIISLDGTVSSVPDTCRPEFTAEADGFEMSIRRRCNFPEVPDR